MKRGMEVIFLIVVLLVWSGCGRSKTQLIQTWIKNLGTNVEDVTENDRDDYRHFLVKAGEDAKPYLLEALQNNDDEEQVSNICWVLANLGAEEAAEPIRRLLQSPNKEHQANAVKSWAILKKEAAIPDLITILKENPSPVVRQAIEEVFRDKKIVSATAVRKQLLPLLRDSARDIRDEIKTIIAEMKSEAKNDLLDLLNTANVRDEKDRQLMVDIFNIFLKIGDPSVKPELKRIKDNVPDEFKFKDKEKGTTTPFQKELENNYNLIQ